MIGGIRKQEKRKTYVCIDCRQCYKAYPSGPPATHRYCCGCYCKRSVEGTLSKEYVITWTKKGWSQGDKKK